MSRIRPVRPQRTPIFVGCEGASEAGYARWLGNCVRDRALPFHLEIYDLGRGAGDPFARIDKAIDQLAHWEKHREPFSRKYIFLDTDQIAANADRAEQARRLALENNFTVIWQDPTHEAFLLCHLPGCDTRQPPDKRTADAALVREWAEYRKPSNAQQLERRLDLNGAIRAARRLPELEDLLRMIGLWDR